MDPQKRAYRNAAFSVLVIALITALACGAMAIIDRTASHDEPVYLEVTENHPYHSPFTVLLIGSDSRKGTALYTGRESEHAQVDQHADIITLVRVDPISHTITLLTIPRDTWFIDRKINASLVDNNPKDVVSEVEGMLNTSIDYYIMVDFIGFENLVNDLDGVVVDVPQKITVPDPATAEDITVKAGDGQLIDGAEALALSRARKEYDGFQDALRQVNVRNIEISLIDSVLSGKVDVSLALNALDAFTTNDVDMGMLKWVAEDFAANYDTIVYYSGTGPYRGENRKSDGEWVIPFDENTWAAVMQTVDAGGDPSSVVNPPLF